MGIPLKQPPVFFTICQVKFNQVLSLPKFVPEIQELFRKAKYPAFTPNRSFMFNVVIGEGQSSDLPPQPVPTSIESFHFGNLERTKSFVLDSEGLTFLSTKYGRYEDFSSEFLQGLEVINDILELSFFERVGLRYINRVMPEVGESIDAYVDSRVQGIMPALDGEGLFSFSESFTRQDNVQLRARALIQAGGLAFPPDIPGTDLEIEPRFKAFKGVSALLDNDGFIQKRQEFSVQMVKNCLDSIYVMTSSAFEKTVTRHAIDHWSK